MEDSKMMAKIAVKALEEKKGEDIKVIDIAGVSVLADYFIIANGNNKEIKIFLLVIFCLHKQQNTPFSKCIP